MENTFLPGTVRERLADLMKYHKVSQTDLALKIGCGDSLLSRFLTGKADKIGDENIIRIARVFYQDVIFNTKPIAGKVYKNSENRRKQGVSCGFRCVCRYSICPIKPCPERG